MRRLQHRKSTTKIKWYTGYGSWKMKADIAGSIHLVVLKLKGFFFQSCILQKLEIIVLTDTLDIVTDDEPKPSFLSQMVLGHLTISLWTLTSDLHV